MIADYVRRPARRGQLADTEAHILRHAFCSHRTMLGAPARSIQELAGHQDDAAVHTPKAGGTRLSDPFA